jgi:hypothetical protein
VQHVHRVRQARQPAAEYRQPVICHKPAFVPQMELQRGTRALFKRSPVK